MDYKLWMYVVYLAISIGLTVWVATTLSRNGMIFLADVFGDEKVARAVNHLLVVGFYLVNLGYVTIAMRTDRRITSAAVALESLSVKIGLVLLVLGALHLFNVLVLSRYRRSRMRRQEIQPPLPPTGYLPVHPPQPPYPPHPPQAPQPPPPPPAHAATTAATAAAGEPPR
jgi:hypothetical protein